MVLLKSLKALAAGNRLRIVRLLMDRKRCVLEIQAAIQTAQSSVSKHLQILEDAGLVEKKRNGRYIDYELSPCHHLEACQAALLASISPILRSSNELEALVRAANRMRRDALSATRHTGSRRP